MARGASAASGGWGAGITITLVALGVACTTAPKADPVRPDPAARAPASTPSPLPGLSATAKPTAGPDVSAWAYDWPTTWTDPRVIDALAGDCAFVPTRTRWVPPDDIARDLFSCTIGYEQSCVPDPCIVHSSKCEDGCSGTCKTCDTSCVGACTTCKEPCRDDACKKACATKCAQCKESCTSAMDRCASGDCNKVHAACTARLKAMWRNNGCAARCAGWKRCSDRCEKAADPDACRATCDTNVSPKLEACMKSCEGVDTSGLCMVTCYETAPCAPFLCMGPPF